MNLYREVHRPQFHFSAKENWINDPNGLVYCDGTWHLFFQHNPESNIWGNMTWGHAISHDLIQWEQVEHALYPDEHGTMFSGSAVIDHNNTAGFGKGAMLLFYTAAGDCVAPERPYTQCLAHSSDNGRTITKYEGNPIIGNFTKGNRDPKVIWHEGSGRWIMALYLIDNEYCLLRSKDCKNWERFQDLTLPGVTECPDFFPLTDESGSLRWLFWGAKGKYLIGSFDGNEFIADTETLTSECGSNGYAAQTWSDAPDGRIVQVSWMNKGLYPEMPFNHQMSIPVELSLIGSGNNARLTRWPVKEFESLRKKTSTLNAQQILGWKNPLVIGIQSDLMELSLDAVRRDSGRLHMAIRGQAVIIDWDKSELGFQGHTVALPNSQIIEILMLIDKASLEVFINKGVVSASFPFLPGAYLNRLELYSDGEQQVKRISVHELNSIW